MKINEILIGILNEDDEPSPQQQQQQVGTFYVSPNINNSAGKVWVAPMPPETR
jgi:hypothetical protein